MNVSAGIDIGSSTIKLVVMEDGRISKQKEVPAASQPLEAAKKLLPAIPQGALVYVTGCGRDLLEVQFGFPAISEIKAHAAGARFLFPRCSTVIDIGGRDIKVISLDEKGRTSRFEMNDRCAAGTGRFLEIMAPRLDYTLDELSDAAIKGTDTLEINARCTVFAESEVVDLVNRGVPKSGIARALHESVAKRIEDMVKRIGPPPDGSIAFTGGGSRNACLRSIVERRLNTVVRYSEASQFAGALGCALCASRDHQG